jgi:diketogulonate reductase-like aldo/keto reductase
VCITGSAFLWHFVWAQGERAALMTERSVLKRDLELRSGLRMPAVGLGTFLLGGPPLVHALDVAIGELGYRLVDTARLYQNEHIIGKWLERKKWPRESIFITSKVWVDQQGYSSTMAAVKASLKALRVSYLDLYLIHAPMVAGNGGQGLLCWGGGRPKESPAERRRGTMQALVECKREGLIRAWGVSNFQVRHLEELRMAGGEMPEVNQVEMSPVGFDVDVLEYCAHHGIVVTGFGNLGPSREPPLVHDPAVASVAKHADKSPAQVLLKWGLQMGAAIIPKSQNRNRIQQNADLDFELSPVEMEALCQMNQGNKHYWSSHAAMLCA